ncbi:MAG: hypothetical protein WD598_08210 [Acidimicrobiia bacterium]
MDESTVARALFDLVAIAGKRHSPALRPLLAYFAKRGSVDVMMPAANDLDELKATVVASPELYGIGPEAVRLGLDQLVDAQMIVLEETEVQFAETQRIARWRIQTLGELEREYSVPTEIREWLDGQDRRVSGSHPLVRHEGIAKVGGDQSIRETLDAARDGGIVRCFAYHGLSTNLTDTVRGLAREGASFELRVLVFREDADERLIEGAARVGHIGSVREGMNELMALTNEMKLKTQGRVRIKIRRYGRNRRETLLRGTLATDRRDAPRRLALVTFRIPNGRGTEGERLVCESAEGGTASLAHLFKGYFDEVWRRSHPLLVRMPWIIVGCAGATTAVLAAFESTRLTALAVLLSTLAQLPFTTAYFRRLVGEA